MHFLIVEDDADTACFMESALRNLGHVIKLAGDGRDGLFQIFDGAFDAIILDRLLPKIDGLEVLKRVRAAGVMTPVLMLTALGSLENKVEGLDAGADDYLVKPFAAMELDARLRALTRRPPALDDPGLFQVDRLEVNLFTRQVRLDGQLANFAPREFEILAELIRNVNNVVTRTMLLHRIWGYRFDPGTNIVEAHISRLRRNLKLHLGEDPIVTLRGVGYMFRDPA